MPRGVHSSPLALYCSLFTAFSLVLSACSPQANAAGPNPTEFIETRVAELLTQGAPTPVPANTPALEFATVTPILTPFKVPTAGATITPDVQADTPPTPGTPCPNQACAALAEHFWLARPVPMESYIYPDRTYAYGSTQQGLREPHHGVEFVNRTGVEVLAAAPGVVIVAGEDSLIAYGPATKFYGQLVVVKLEQEYNGQPVFNLYAHLSDVLVKEGQRVQTGELLGAVGQTGVAIGPHLHFEVRVGRNAYTHTRNPELWVAPYAGWGVLAGQLLDDNGRYINSQPIEIYAADSNRLLYTVFTYGDRVARPDDEWRENFVISDLPAGRYRLRTILGLAAPTPVASPQPTLDPNLEGVAGQPALIQPPPPVDPGEVKVLEGFVDLVPGRTTFIILQEEVGLITNALPAETRTPVYPTNTPTATLSPTSTNTATSTRTPRPTNTLTPSRTPSPTRTATITRTPTRTPTPRP
ncbi:MAG: M23 family metallopeptidase [Anaerolineales bacterium]|nr:M23 family metallopeptidase [Anaerolineales bacterium]